MISVREMKKEIKEMIRILFLVRNFDKVASSSRRGVVVVVLFAGFMM